MRAYIVTGLRHYEKVLEIAEDVRREVGLEVHIILSPGLDGVVVNGLYVGEANEEVVAEGLLVSMIAEQPIENLLLSCCA